MGDHHLLGKGGYFDGSYHVPLIIRDPRRTPDRAGVARFTEAVDLLPTLLDLMGLPPQPWLDGRSLAPFLDGKAPDDWRDEAHVEFDFRTGPGGSSKRMPASQRTANLAVLRGERYKLVHFAAGPSLLFDLADDPTETVDRSRDPDYRDILVDMLERLLAWRAAHLDQSLALGELSDEGPRGPFAPLPRPVRCANGKRPGKSRAFPSRSPAKIAVQRLVRGVDEKLLVTRSAKVASSYSG